MESICRTKAEKFEKEVFKYHNDDTGWTQMRDHKGVEIYYKKSPHFNGNLYRFEYDLDLPADKVFEVMKPPPDVKDRLEWDKSIKDYLCLDVYAEDLIAGVMITHSVLAGLISSREFVDLYYFKPQVPSQNEKYEYLSWVLESTYLSWVLESTDHSKRPASKNCVRGFNYPTGYAVAKYKSLENKCRMIMYVNCDIGGMIPQSLVEKALPGEQVAYMQNVKAETEKRIKRAA